MLSTVGPSPSRHHPGTCSPSAVKEEELEREMEKEDDDSWSNKHDCGDTLSNPSDDEEDNETGGFGRNTVLANRRNVDEVQNTDGSSDAGANQEGFKGEKRRSSWGSSLEDSDTDLPKEEEVSHETLDQTSDVQASDLQPEAETLHSKCSSPQPKEDQPDTSWDSSTPVVPSPKCVTPQPVMDEPVSPIGLCSASTHQSKNRPSKATVDESEWDSSSENNDHNENEEAEAGEQRCSDDSLKEEDEESVGEESNNPSPVVSSAPEDEKASGSQILDNNDVEQTSQMEEKLDPENEKGSDSSWDDEEESHSENQKTMLTMDDEVAACGDVLKTCLSTPTKSGPTSPIDKKLEGDEVSESFPQSVIEGKDESPEDNLEVENLAGVENDKEGETSEDSDSQDVKLQYDFTNATVKVCDDDNEEEARLTAYVPLENKSAIAPQTRVSSEDLNEDPTSPSAAGQHHDSDGNMSDEALPQTDIDDVHLDSPDEAESISMTGQELRNTEEPVKEEDSTGDEDDNDQEEEKDDDDDDDEEEEEEEEDASDEHDQPERTAESLNATSPFPETEVSKDKKRDLMSELGLEKGEEEQDSWDSESQSESRNTPHEEKQSLCTQGQTEMSTVEEELKENLFYIPSFLRGEGSNRMAVIEPRRNVGRPRSSQGEVGDDNNGDKGGEHVDEDDTIQKETDKAKWEPLRVLSNLEGDNEGKTDLMEELGLGDVDDLEDASDWDSASTTSKRTLPGRRMLSPGLEEFPECSYPSVKEQDEDIVPVAPPTPQRSINSNKTPPSTPPQPAPQPTPRARKMVLQTPESEEESDWEPDNVAPSCNASAIDNQLQNTAEAVGKPGSPELSPTARDSESSEESEEQQQKEIDDPIDKCEFDLNNPCPSGHVASDCGEKDNDFRDQHSPEEKGAAGENVPWENRYEKLWVEVEKREVKSTFKNVAGELKERFGELLKSRCSAEDSTEEQAMAESVSAGEESSDEEEGEVIVRPMARARSTVLLTIPEQRESGLEDSATESTDNSLCEDRMQVREPAREINMCQGPDLLTDDVLDECSSPSPQLTIAQRDDCIHPVSADFTDTIPMSRVDHSTFLKDEAKHGPFQKPHLDFVWKDNTSNLDKAEKNSVSSEEDPEEFTKSRPPSLSRRSASIPGVSDEELEEDMERYKLEPDKETTKTAMEVQRSSTSWDTGGSALEEVGTEKPETRLPSLSSQAGAVHQEQQLTATKSTNGAPVQLHLPLQQTYNSIKQEGQAVDETSRLELVRGARRSRAPQTNTHVNGDPLSVFDDSTLSDVSDDEGRFPTSGQQKNENPEEMENAEDFDELTQSSDTATDDIDSPTSGYRHASLLIQKLDSATLDSRSMVKLQNIFHEYERSIQKARSRHGYLSDKVTQLEMERAELKSSLEEVKDFKSALERNQLELQTEVTNLKFQLKQEQENRRNATMMYNTTRDKLRRTEEQHQLEVQERQKVELTLRNLELEMRTLVNNIKQLEEDHSETQRLLAQERSARTLQENLLNSHLRKQQEIEDENKRNISKSNEALSQLTEASDRERELLQQTSTLQEQLSIVRTDLERLQANSSLKESHLLEENDTLKEQLEDARRDLKLNSEALTQTVFNCNNQVTALKSELAITTTRLENERQTREALEGEVESTRTRLAGAVKEAELCQAAHTDTERALLREKEEHQRLKDRLTGDAASQREAISSLSQKLAKAETRANSMENEVHRATLQLTEKGLLLEVQQREKDQVAVRVKELEAALQAEREQASRAGARQEATQERLAQTQSEGMLLRQQLEEAQNKGVAKERAVTDAQERFSDILSKLRSDSEERVQLVEDRNKELASKAADLRDQIYKLEEEKSERETSLRQLQQELADSLKKLSMSEASLEVNTRYRNDLEEEKARLHKDLDRLKGKLEESEDQYVQAERRINSLKSSLDEREKELASAALKHQEALSASGATDLTIKQLEEAVQRLEIENARLEAAAKQQSNKIEALQKGAQESAMVRGHLENLVTNLQSSKMTLEDQLSREVQKQSMLSHTAQDSQALWEEELKSRSKLGLRLAELEKEKGDLGTQMEIEKKKAKKIAEQKKAIDTRLDQEMKRNTELQKEMYRLRTLLKTAKKKLRDQDTAGAEFGSPMSSLRMDVGRRSQVDASFGQMKEKVDDLQMRLEKEGSRRSQLEKVNGDLKDQLASLKGLSRSSDQLERSKRQLEEEVLDLRRRMEAAQMEQSQVEQYRRDAEDRARQEIQQKLEQVNIFLQSQAASQEALDQIKAANEANLRSQMEQKIRELEGELGRARANSHDSLNQRDSTRTELDRYRQLYTEELRIRKSLAAKLERANSRLAEANSKLLNERSRSLITSSIANGSLGGPSLDVGSLGSPAHYGATLGPLNRSLGLGLSFLSPVTEGQNSRVEDYLAKMQNELDRNISKELNNATAELDAASARMSPVGSASRVELDPVSRATQQYLEVLKKNNMI
ncbi:ankyrin repeat domain-containing protein 26 isoform X1 [Centropristis striata]|uniref:ankyrin repeat domain-containing protein 26 isoform X1 n=1 Tax=Centropristis striata TaxID=184440 RepID=UPI0027E0F853|nr:ankyrin repeat domain-containing protein 26 isoform X1 [Centropristis striata]